LRKHAWQAVLPLGLLGLVAMLFADPETQNVIYVIFTVSAAVALIFGVYPCRRYRPGTWAMLMLGMGIGLLAEISLPFFSDPIFGSVNPLTPGNICGLMGYGLVAIAFFTLIQGSHRNFDRTGLIIDSAILIAGFVLVYGLIFIDPIADAHGVSLPVRISATLNPALDILFLGVALRFLLTRQNHSSINPMVVGLMVAANVQSLFSDSITSFATLTSAPVMWTLVNGAGLLAWVCWMSFALHPDLLTLLNPSESPIQHISYRRSLALGLLALLAPLAITARWALGLDPQVALLAPIEALLVTLVLLRMINIVRSLQDSLAQREILAGELEEARARDTLTGLANRRRLTDKLEDLVLSRRPAALMLFDLDDFKEINDTLGHATGDTILQMVAGRLSDLLPSAEMIARLGADEFAILLTEAEQIEALPDIAEKIVSAMAAPFDFGGKLVHARISAGIARITDSSGPAVFGELEPTSVGGIFELLRNAEIAMFLAKARGKDRFEIFRPAMLDSVLKHATTLTDLERAIEQGEIVSYYQPIVDLRNGRIIGAEALARWQHPERGLIQPNDFIPLAESSGLILPLGNSLLGAACRQAALWPADAAGETPCLHVNLTVRQLHTFGFAETVARCLRLSGLAPAKLTLEVLESTMVDKEAQAVLWDIHALGVKLFLDDFGTGYSSLSYLANLPLDGIKIDRAFVSPLTADSRDYDILEGILGIAHRLKLEVVAEGIETAEQRRALLDLGSFIGQGYLFSRAVPDDQFRAMLIRKQTALQRAA
jgi:diguanylate cyclase (GGDEF)-like protein